MFEAQVDDKPIVQNVGELLVLDLTLPAMQGTAQQYAKYASELQCPPAFIALMLRDIADTFEENAIIGDKGCDCC